MSQQTEHEPNMMGIDPEWMFIFHWQSDNRLHVLYSGIKAASYLGSDIWTPHLQGVEDVFQDVLLSGLKTVYASGRYNVGQHVLDAPHLGAGVSLVFHAIDNQAEGVFWHGYLRKDSKAAPGVTKAGLDPEVNPSLRWLILADNTSDFVWFKDIEGRYLYTNATFNRFYGLETGEAIGKMEAELFGEERAIHIGAEDERAIQSGKRTQCSETTQGADTGDLVTLDISRQPIIGTDGAVTGLLCTGRDLTKYRRRERELSREIGLLHRMLDTVGTKVAYYNATGDLTYANRPLMEEFALKQEHLSLINVLTSKMFDARGGEFRKGFVKCVETREPAEIVSDFVTPGGNWSRDNIKFIPHLSDDGDLEGVLGIGSRISDDFQREMATDIERAAASQLGFQLETLLRSTKDAVWIKDAEGRFVAANDVFHKLTGVLSLDAIGHRTLVTENELPPEIAGPDKLDVLAAGEPIQIVERVRFAEDNIVRSLSLSLSPIRNPEGRFLGLVGIARDISDSKRLAAELESARKHLSQAAYSDTLTGLPNERHARDKIGEVLQDCQAEPDACGAVFLVNIDRFGGINDSLGYAAGDVLLARLAERIKQAAKGCYVARLSGDEFIVLAREISREEAEKQATEILETVRQPLFSEGRYLTISASIGITPLPGSAKCQDDVLTQAGLALREARRTNTNSFHIFDADLVQAARDRFTLEADIRRGLEEGQFEAYYQPKIDLKSKRVTGAEALLRWRHPRRGNIPPAMFIPLAEETGLILPLGETVLYDSCQFAREWNERSENPLKVAVNLSPRQLMSDHFLAMLERTLEKTNCRPEWLELEITENLLLSDHLKVDRLLKELHQLGVSIAIDDFGTGYSAMAYLIDYPINTLKVDRSFVRDVITDQKKAVLVKAILDMANGLGMNTVAEGIENNAEAAWVQRAGCREGQGFLWCKAIPKLSFLEWAQVFADEDAAAE